MAFIDWNNNGEIDDEDIAIGVALIDSEEEEESSPQKSGNVIPGDGCLTGALFSMVIIGVIFVGVLFIV